TGGWLPPVRTAAASYDRDATPWPDLPDVCWVSEQPQSTCPVRVMAFALSLPHRIDCVSPVSKPARSVASVVLPPTPGRPRGGRGCRGAASRGGAWLWRWSTCRGAGRPGCAALRRVRAARALRARGAWRG